MRGACALERKTTQSQNRRASERPLTPTFSIFLSRGFAQRHAAARLDGGADERRARQPDAPRGAHDRQPEPESDPHVRLNVQFARDFCSFKSDLSLRGPLACAAERLRRRSETCPTLSARSLFDSRARDFGVRLRYVRACFFEEAAAAAGNTQVSSLVLFRF